MKNELLNIGLFDAPHNPNDGGTRTAMIPEEKLREVFQITTVDERQAVQQFAQELAQTGQLMTEMAAEKMVEGFQEAVKARGTDHMILVDSMGHVMSAEQAAAIEAQGRFIPAPITHKQRRAEKAAKKREAKYRRSQLYRELGRP